MKYVNKVKVTQLLQGYMKLYPPRRGERGGILLIAVRKEHSRLRSRAHMG